MTAVEVVIAVHSESRPIERAVRSVLAAGKEARALVVVHGMPIEPIARRLEGLDGGRIRLIRHDDGRRSPAGPRNAGFTAAEGPYVSVLDSDDELDPEALDTALRRIEETGVEVCILPQRNAGGPQMETPLVRAGRARVLDVVRDRLFTRTGPLCVMPADLARDLMPLYDTRFRNGEDISASARIWAAHTCVYVRTDPGNVMHHDADDRVTSRGTLRLDDVLEAPTAIASDAWVGALSPMLRQSLAAKMIRVHLLGVLDRADVRDETEARLAQACLSAWLDVSRAATRGLSRSDRRVLDAVAVADPQRIRAALDARNAAGRLSRLMPRNPLRLLDRDGDLRRLLVYRAYRRAERG